MQEPVQQPKSAASALDQIREGGTQLVTVAMERLEEVRAALMEGRFTDAADRANELMGRIAPLSNAQAYIGTFGECYVVRAADVAEGMVLRSWGRVSNVEREMVAVAGNDDHMHVTLHLDGSDEPKQVNGDQELIALRHDAPTPEF